MIAWSERTTELANLLNPAFCGFLVREAVSSFATERDSGMPLSLTFLVLPLVLHRATREAFPRAVSTTFLSWLQANPEVRLGFAMRSRSLVPFTREALLFLLDRGLLTVRGEALGPGSVNWSNSPRGLMSRVMTATTEIEDCIRRARFLGRWLALAPTDTTIYTFLGIQP